MSGEEESFPCFEKKKTERIFRQIQQYDFSTTTMALDECVLFENFPVERTISFQFPASGFIEEHCNITKKWYSNIPRIPGKK